MVTADATALVVVDMQRAFVTGSGAVPGADDLQAVVHHLVRRARDAGALVVHVQNDGASGAADEPDTPGWALVLEPMMGEPVIRKHADDAFVDTGLEALLRDVGADVVVICGVQSEMCVAATARTAMERGLVVVLPRDGHGTYPVPPDGDGGVAVSATQVARVAEWSLGDGLVVPTSSADVIFRRAAPAR
jgi:nicotinamidase-related amidase